MNSLLLIPFLTALLGWVLAWLFVKSLFFPYYTVQIGNFKWEAGLKQLIAKLPIEQFLQTDDAKNGTFNTVLPFIDAKLDDFFKHKLGEKLPMISMFIGEKTIGQLKEIFIDELRQLFPDLIGKFGQGVKDNMVDNMEQKWRPLLEPALLKATKSLRTAALFIGFSWGILMVLILNWF